MKGMKFGLKSMEIVYQQELSDSTKVSKEIVPFQQEFPIVECDVKNDPTGHPESDEKSDSGSDSQCC